MNFKTIIFNSELEFRKYVIQHSKDIQRIVVFEDIPDNTIFFYCFMQKKTITATKESSSKNFFSYLTIYEQLAFKLQLHVISYKHKELEIYKIKEA